MLYPFWVYLVNFHTFGGFSIISSLWYSLVLTQNLQQLSAPGSKTSGFDFNHLNECDFSTKTYKGSWEL